MTRPLVIAGAWLLLLTVAVIVWVAYHEIAWRLHERRRRHELMVDLTRRVRQ